MSEDKEYTGGSVSYYAIDVNAPLNENSDPYTAECQDIIEALKLDYNEGNVLKAIWRRAAARLGRSKKGYDDGLYDAEKIAFYGQRLVAIEQRAKRIAKLVSPAEQLVADAVEALTADPFGPRDADGWYPWNGDETLRPEGRVEVQWLDGGRHEDVAEVFLWGPPGSIVKWRPAQ